MKSSWLVWTVVIRAGPLLFGNFEFRPLFRERARAPFPVNSYYTRSHLRPQFRAIESNSGKRNARADKNDVIVIRIERIKRISFAADGRASERTRFARLIVSNVLFRKE